MYFVSVVDLAWSFWSGLGYLGVDFGWKMDSRIRGEMEIEMELESIPTVSFPLDLAFSLTVYSVQPIVYKLELPILDPNFFCDCQMSVRGPGQCFFLLLHVAVACFHVSLSLSTLCMKM